MKNSPNLPVIWRPSPNFNERPDGAPIDMIVIHYTDMETGEAALSHMCSPDAKVSSHYMIEEDGRIFQLVEEEKRAWHAGVSAWRGRVNLNDYSIGIELCNPGHSHGYYPFPEAQMQALAALCKGIMARHPVPPENVVGHSDIAPGRKQDPGPLFDWEWLKRAGVGVGVPVE